MRSTRREMARRPGSHGPGCVGADIVPGGQVPVELVPRISMPFAVFPDITFPEVSSIPPIRLDAALLMSTPVPFETGPVPEALVPMKFNDPPAG